MARETVDNYVWLLENLLIMNQGMYPKLIITDLESSKVTAIEQVLAPRTVHLLCQWSMAQSFRKHFGYLIKKNNTKKSSKLLYSNIIDTIYTESPKRFSELLDFIFCLDVVELLDEVKMNFLKSLVTIKEKWAAAHVPLMFNAGFQSTLKSEAVNYLIKRGMQ